MDSITQLVLGGTVAYAAIGNKVGRKAALYGAALGTLPDLDVLINFGGDVENFIFHRSFSHSLLVQFAATPLLAWLITKFHSDSNANFKAWCIAVYLCLSTHSLLDTCTVYGTQLLWPVSDYPFGLSNLFIVDPLYTLPLLAVFIALLLIRDNSAKAHRLSLFGLACSTGYILWGLAAKYHIDAKVQQALAARGITSTIYQSTPAPFTTLLWRSVAVIDGGYYEIYASVFDSRDEVSIERYPSAAQLLSPIQDTWGVKNLQRFTKGLYGVKQQGEAVLLSDLRMGLEGAYVFSFEVGRIVEGTVVPGSFAQVSQRPAFKEAAIIYQRIWQPSVSLTPTARQAYLNRQDAP